MKVCPECLEAPASEQRDGIKKDARCRACVKALRQWGRYLREALSG